MRCFCDIPLERKHSVRSIFPGVYPYTKRCTSRNCNNLTIIILLGDDRKPKNRRGRFVAHRTSPLHFPSARNCGNDDKLIMIRMVRITNVVTVVRITASTGIRCISTRNTCGSSHDTRINMISERKLFVRTVLTTGACFICAPPHRNARGGLFFMLNQIMPEFFLFAIGRIFASRTSLISKPPIFRTGCRLFIMSNERMTSHFAIRFFPINSVKENISDGCCRDGIYNTITINIPTEKLVNVLFIIRNLVNRESNNLRIQAGFFIQEFPVFIIKSYPTPLISVDDVISIIPTGEIIIPPQVFFFCFYKYRNIRNVLEKLHCVLQFRRIYRIQEHNTFQRKKIRNGRGQVVEKMRYYDCCCICNAG